ncbi:MAG: response regulator [Proteobacteria bacterium]|nr:response regulator [Pseudomonadota bacterium]
MHVPFFYRLSFVQARNTLLLACLLALATGSYQIYSDFCRHRQETARMIRQVMMMQVESAALAAWSLDIAAAERVTTGLFQYLPIKEASLASDTGSVLAKKVRPHSAPGHLSWLAEKIVESRDFSSQLFIEGVEEPIGTLSFRVDSNVIAASFFDRTISNILASAIPLIFLSLILVLMFHYLLTRPLFHLSGRLAAIDPEKPLQEPLEIPAGHEHDELGLVVDTTNRLLSKFEQTLEHRRFVEMELQAAETKYRSIFDNAVEGIYQTSLDGRFLSANPALAKAIGYDNPAQLMAEVTDIGRQLYVDKNQRNELVEKLMHDGFVVNIETLFYRKDGTTIWASQSARVVYDEATGKPLFIEGTVADISGSKKAMADLARVEAQLMQSQKMEALGNLAGGVAHDFNNLLQIISGLVQLLLMKKSPSDPDYRYLHEVNKAAGRAAELIRRMLTFSRKVDAQKVPLNLNKVIEEALRLLERTVPKMISIRTSLTPDLAIIPADSMQMEQVIMNLVNNAVQAMGDTGTLTIETENFPVPTKYIDTYLELDPGDYVLMRVTDSGHGMDEATRQRIFEPFFTTKAPGRGTGLGLSSVYGIITSHSGKIICYSEQGVGTTFKIFLPVMNGEVRLRLLAEQDTTPISGGTENILLVDDEEPLLEIAGDILQQCGYSTCTARSGEDAIEIYREHAAEIHLVLMDLGMPGMGGKKCLEILREMDPSIKVIIASGYGSYDITKNPRQYGASAFLSKPYRLDILSRTVREVLDRI